MRQLPKWPASSRQGWAFLHTPAPTCGRTGFAGDRVMLSHGHTSGVVFIRSRWAGGGQAVQFQPGGMPGNVLVVPLRRDHSAVVTAEFQFRQGRPWHPASGHRHLPVGAAVRWRQRRLPDTPALHRCLLQPAAAFGQDARNAVLKAGGKVGHIDLFALHLGLVHLVEHGGLQPEKLTLYLPSTWGTGRR